ncbi:hypothetical protein [Anaerosinus gibii]|uniref:Uncharacterized protein n=1 Tax=Selenobaculum gibii TaxID=3054208 RepID=A0A9Y2AJB0_9FIRM|nr:hypothetical protein [Selenobaculum gbiensis]WIW70866.1 hypothetical protein P3F81_00645 [Selenobaculum gbiensis]
MSYKKQSLIFICSILIAICSGYYATSQRAETFHFKVIMPKHSQTETINLATLGFPKKVLQGGQIRIISDRQSFQNNSAAPLHLKITMTGLPADLKIYTKSEGWQCFDSPLEIIIEPNQRILLGIETNLSRKNSFLPFIGNIDLTIEELNQQNRLHIHKFELVNL